MRTFGDLMRNIWGGPARVNFAPPQAPGADAPATNVTVPVSNIDATQFHALATPQTRGAALTDVSGLGLRRVTLPASGATMRDDRLGVDPRPSNGQH